jgi:hypothetical protein
MRLFPQRDEVNRWRVGEERKSSKVWGGMADNEMGGRRWVEHQRAGIRKGWCCTGSVELMMRDHAPLPPAHGTQAECLFPRALTRGQHPGSFGHKPLLKANYGVRSTETPWSRDTVVLGGCGWWWTNQSLESANPANLAIKFRMTDEVRKSARRVREFLSYYQVAIILVVSGRRLLMEHQASPWATRERDLVRTAGTCIVCMCTVC